MHRHIGKYIQKLRSEAGMTQEELAVKIRKSKALVSFIESKGQVNDNTLRTIAKVLNLPFETLKVYPYIELDSQASDVESLKKRIQEQDREIELLKKVIEGNEKVIQLLESKIK